MTPSAYHTLPIEEKESYRWIEVSKNTKAALSDIVERMVIVQDREGDIYEQFAVIPDAKTDLLIRARTNRTLLDKSKLFNCLSDQEAKGNFELLVNGTQTRKKRKAKIEIRYKEIEINKTDATSKGVAPTIKLNSIEAKKVNYSGGDQICRRLLTTIPVESEAMAKTCIEWYSWRWTIEEVFKILKKEG